MASAVVVSPQKRTTSQNTTNATPIIIAPTNAKIIRANSPVLKGELVRQLEELFDGLTIRKEFEEWGLEAIQAINSEEADERQKIIDNQTKALKEAEKQG